MSEDKKLSVKEEFELREKRLKLVYKILYVLAALWIALFISLPSIGLDVEFSAMYSFLLAVLSCYIISIVKYALRELSCMKISGKSTETEKAYADESFADIWRNCIIILAVGALLMLATMRLSNQTYLTCSTIIFLLGSIYLVVVAILDALPEKVNKRKLHRPSNKCLKVLQIISLPISVAVAYSLFSMFCWAAMN